MKKIIFICLLSLSVCFSNPTDQQGASVPTQPLNVPNAGAKSEIPVKPTENRVVEPPHTKQTSTAQNSPAPDQNTTQTVQNNSTLAQNPSQTQNLPQNTQPNKVEATTTGTNSNNSVTDSVNNKTENKTKTEEKKVEPTKDGTKPEDSKHEGAKPEVENKKSTDPMANIDNKAVGNNETKPENKTEKNGTPMQKGDVTTKSTEPPKTDAEKHVVLQGRSFDGPSFIGGIILTLGLLAIGFMGFKYYKNQTERNYHTL